jgi:hypothetical protein
MPQIHVSTPGGAGSTGGSPINRRRINQDKSESQEVAEPSPRSKLSQVDKVGVRLFKSLISFTLNQCLKFGTARSEIRFQPSTYLNKSKPHTLQRKSHPMP